MYGFLDVDGCFGEFTDVTQNTFGICCPLFKYTSSANPVKRWITPEVITAGRGLKHLYWLHVIMACPTTYDMYKKAKSSYNSLIRKAKQKQKSVNKNKTVWFLVNALTGREKIGHRSMELLVGGVSYVEAEDLALVFADYFSTVTQNTLDLYYKNSLYSS